MKPYILNYTNPTEDDMTCTFPAFIDRPNYTVKKMEIHSDNDKNLEITFKITGYNTAINVSRPFEINSSDCVYFKMQPWSNMTITLYPTLSPWQRIKNLFGI